MDITQLVIVVLAVGGFGALVSAGVNVLKVVGLVKDGDAPTWITGFNLLGVIALYVASAFKLPFDLEIIGPQMGIVAQFLVALGQLIIMFGGSKLFYAVARGAPLIGKSHSI
jgi:uncharacterized membrane protein